MILAAANCPPLRDTVQALTNRCRAAWRGIRSRPTPGSCRAAPTTTTASAEALDKPDPKRARKLLHAHVLDTGETLARWL